MAQASQPAGQPLTSSQREWLRVRDYLREHRHQLGASAAAEYTGAARFEGSPLLTRREWQPERPVPFGRIQLDLVHGKPFRGVDGTERASESVRPLRPDGRRYRRYSEVVADLAAPAVFENRGTYRLLDADVATDSPRLTFDRGTYFDGIDTGEAAGHEFAAVVLAEGNSTPFRSAIGNPLDPGRRPINLAISALTIRRDARAGNTFLIHWRDPKRVGHAGGLYQVLPVGIFQPASDHPWNERNDFSLWRCLVREYAEELLGEDERDATRAPIDYSAWPFAHRMAAALYDGAIRAWCLGLGVDPLTLATDLLAVVVFDAPVFDDLFPSLASSNAEGELISSSAESFRGIPFDTEHVTRFVEHEPMQAAGAAVLLSAWRHRTALLQ